MSSLVMGTSQHYSRLSPKQAEDIRNIICRGASEDETQSFLRVCDHTGLDPFQKQIFFVKRWDSKLGKDIWIPQTSVDGLRLIADRTGKYCPGPPSTCEMDANGKIKTGTSFVKKLTSDGTWHTVEVTIFFDEYAQYYKDKKTGEMVLSSFWKDKPFAMITKCAEALALRKSFPAETGNLMTSEEMDRPIDVQGEVISDRLSQEQLNELYTLSVQLPEITEKFMTYYKITSFLQLDPSKFDTVKRRLEEELSKVKINEIQNAMDGE